MLYSSLRYKSFKNSNEKKERKKNTQVELGVKCVKILQFWTLPSLIFTLATVVMVTGDVHE